MKITVKFSFYKSINQGTFWEYTYWDWNYNITNQSNNTIMVYDWCVRIIRDYYFSYSSTPKL